LDINSSRQEIVPEPLKACLGTNAIKLGGPSPLRKHSGLKKKGIGVGAWRRGEKLQEFRSCGSYRIKIGTVAMALLF
jgi:hypothetical protein